MGDRQDTDRLCNGVRLPPGGALDGRWVEGSVLAYSISLVLEDMREIAMTRIVKLGGY